MRRLLLFMVLAGCGRISFAPATGAAGIDGEIEPEDASASPPWQLVQTVSSVGSTLTLAPSGARHLIVVAAQLSNAGSVTSITDNADDDNVGHIIANENDRNTYLAIPGARATNTNPTDALELWYVANSRPGASTIRIVATSNVVAAVAWEVSGIRTDAPLDTAGALDGQPATTTPKGPPITTSAAGEFVVSAAIVANVVSGTDTGNEFTNDSRTKGNGWAHLTDPMAPAGNHQAQWTQDTSGRYCASAAAFQVGP